MERDRINDMRRMLEEKQRILLTRTSIFIDFSRNWKNTIIYFLIWENLE